MHSHLSRDHPFYSPSTPLASCDFEKKMISGKITSNDVTSEHYSMSRTPAKIYSRIPKKNDRTHLEALTKSDQLILTDTTSRRSSTNPFSSELSSSSRWSLGIANGTEKIKPSRFWKKPKEDSWFVRNTTTSGPEHPHNGIMHMVFFDLVETSDELSTTATSTNEHK